MPASVHPEYSQFRQFTEQNSFRKLRTLKNPWGTILGCFIHSIHNLSSLQSGTLLENQKPLRKLEEQCQIVYIQGTVFTIVAI